jgi:hypothetical protein
MLGNRRADVGETVKLVEFDCLGGFLVGIRQG